MRRDRAEDRGHAVALIFIVLASGLSGRTRPRRAHLTRELFGAFVHANQRASRVGLARIDFEDVLHRRDKFGAARRRDYPLLFLPWFKFVFLSVWRTASWLMVSTISNSTSRAANKRRVQRARPCGAAPQLRAMSCASALPSSLRGYSRSGSLRSRARSNPCSTQTRRTRSTVGMLVCAARAICESLQ